MEERRQGNVKYKGFGIQGMAGKETSGLIYWFILY